MNRAEQLGELADMVRLHIAAQQHVFPLDAGRGTAAIAIRWCWKSSKIREIGGFRGAICSSQRKPSASRCTRSTGENQSDLHSQLGERLFQHPGIAGGRSTSTVRFEHRPATPAWW